MNFIVGSTVLLKHIQSIAGVVGNNSSMPILDNFLFEIGDGELKISASDVETTMSTKLKVEANKAGKVAVPKIILDILKTLPDQPITISVDPKTFAIDITYDNGKSHMAGFDGDEFPKAPVFKGGSSVKINGEIVSRAIGKTLFATGNDDLRPVMCGVYCQFSSEDIVFVATDAHKLVRFRRTDASSTEGASFILPKKPLNLLKANLKGDEEVLIEYNTANAIFTFGDSVMICRLIDGKYPNYEAVIPKENPNVLTVDRNQFLSAVKRVSLFASKSTPQVHLKMAGSELNISAEDNDFNNSATERMTCKYDGEDMEIGFNSRFLMELLSNVESTEVRIEMSDPSRAGLIIPNEPHVEGEDLLLLVMPVMVGR